MHRKRIPLCQGKALCVTSTMSEGQGGPTDGVDAYLYYMFEQIHSPEGGYEKLLLYNVDPIFLMARSP